MLSLLTEKYGASQPHTYSEAQEKRPVYYNQVEMANYDNTPGKQLVNIAYEKELQTVNIVCHNPVAMTKYGKRIRSTKTKAKKHQTLNMVHD